MKKEKQRGGIESPSRCYQFAPPRRGCFMSFDLGPRVSPWAIFAHPSGMKAAYWDYLHEMTT
jgi:hypothetical protein